MHYHDITIHLKEPNDLFTQPAMDVANISTQYLYVSGMDYLISVLRPTSLRLPTRTIIYLPANQITTDIVDKLKQAIVSYCDFQITEIRHTFQALRWEGFKALQVGVVWLVVCLSLSIFFSEVTLPDFLPDFTRNVLSEGFLIAGWVGIWRPTEIFLYSWWPHWREAHIYQNIRKMEIIIKPDPDNIAN